jgi:AbiV family abortive infection protein
MDRQTYTLCYYNGKKHIDLGKRLGEEKDYGTAITFFVLGLEELIKYLVVKMSLADKSLFTDAEINKIFGSHTGKHKIIIEFLQATKLDFGENFALATFNKMTNQPLTDELKLVDANRFKQLGSMVGLTERHLTGDEIDLFINWLSENADNLKNKGLYVDREDRSKSLVNTKLVSPSDTEEEDFNFVLKFTDSFLKQTTFSKDLDLTDDEFIKMLNDDFGI